MTRAPRLGILGGTFDPVHEGHLQAAELARRSLALDQVLLVPCHVPPHRQDHPRASPYHRFAMIALAAMSRQDLVASDLELAAPGPSYTAATLDRLHEAGHRPSQLFFITGSDAFAEIATWRRYPALLEACHFVVIPRSGHDAGVLRARLPELEGRFAVPEAVDPGTAITAPGPAIRIWLVGGRTPDVSSTEIRRRVAAGAPLDELVPSAVAAYIARHGLYLTPAPAGATA